ncbi:MAG TPA: acyl-CoA dehydrogenase family protein [Myxococcota bacterium]|nr:acyl-CoA dehydrogenase family protein [Myxococcota bacterium]
MIPYQSATVDLYLRKLIDWEEYYRLRTGLGADVTAERTTLEDVLGTAAQICTELEPELRAGWHQAAKLVGGEVVYPPHIKKAYDTLAAAGLVSFGVAEEYGGYGLPAWVTNVILQMIARADAGLMTIIGLQAGVADDIQYYASDELKQRYLPGLASGELMGAMDLTEPQAGSDLGAIRTRATETAGEIRLDGEKIFITNGGSAVHLVLARDADTYDASLGTTNGLSLYLCPRTLPDGTANAIEITRLEEKLGIHGSPTAAVAFRGAVGFRVGKKGQGFRAMLTLMNNARLGVAAQGIGIAEAALDAAVRYARERRQFGAPIADQPLMKNLLARMVTGLEGSRALLYRACALLDRNRSIEAALARGGMSEAERAEWEAIRERNEIRVRLLTPLAKYVATEIADDITRQAIQVHGGLGFMAESVPGKLHADAIITTIYEGTSEIQVSFALKEVGKGALAVVFDDVERDLAGLARAELAPYADRVRKGIGQVLAAAPALAADMGYALLSAQSLAESVISVVVSAELLRQADADPSRFDVAASWIERRMVDLEGRTERIRRGSPALIERCARMIAQAVPA